MRILALWRAAVMVGLVAAFLGWPNPATAQTLSMTLPVVADFQPVVLTGSATSTTATMGSFSVSDLRLLTGGWNVTIAATQFREWNGSQYVDGGRALPTGSLTMATPVLSSLDLGSTRPVITPGPYRIDGSSIKIISTPAESGQGTYTFLPGGPLRLAIPASAYAVTYRSEITLSLAAGP